MTDRPRFGIGHDWGVIVGWNLAIRHPDTVVKRTDYTFEAVKTTLQVDCETSAFLDIHCSMKQPDDTHVGWQVLTRNLGKLTALAADKGYDWEQIRTRLRAESITPLIPQRDPGFRDWARSSHP